jgi:thymidylate kinase
MCGGVPDGPQLLRLLPDPDQYRFRRLLARIETRLYQEIPSPDLVIALSVPVEVAISRNRTRGKTEPEAFVRMRHAQSAKLEFGTAPVYPVNTNQPVDQTVLEVKKAIWSIL